MKISKFPELGFWTNLLEWYIAGFLLEVGGGGPSPKDDFAPPPRPKKGLAPNPS